MLEIRNLHAAAGGAEILKGIDLTVRAGEIHAVMGPNGSGKSTLAQVLAGHPAYEVTEGEVRFDGKDLLELQPEERAREGLFLAFQYPTEIRGVTNAYFLRAAVNAMRKHRGEQELDTLEFYDFLKEKLDVIGWDDSLMSRPVNDGFSGGEKKDIMALFFLCQKTDSYLDIPRPILGYDEIFSFVQELLQEDKLSWDRNQSDIFDIEFSSQHPTKVQIQPIFTILSRFKPVGMISVKASSLYDNHRFRNDYYFNLSKDWGVDPVAEVPLGVCASLEFEMFLESANLVKKGNELIKISLLEKEFLSCAKKFGLNMNVSKIVAGRKRISSGREELERVKEAPLQEEEKDIKPYLIRPARTLVCRKGKFTFTKNQFPIIELFFDNYDNENNYISEQDALVGTDEAIKAKKSGEVDRYSMSSFKSIFKSRRAYFKAIFEQHPEEKDLWRLNLD